MKIGIIGTGPVGRALGKGLAEVGHEVMMGSRAPTGETVSSWMRETSGKASSGSLSETAKFGEIVVLATAWSGTENALKLAEADNMAGKILIDVTNPLVTREDGPPDLALGHNDSGGEQVQRWAPNAMVVKTLNIVNNAVMINPQQFKDGPTMYLCGNDAEAKGRVQEILKSLGWKDVIDIGGLDGARQLEQMCILWVKSAMAVGDWNVAFKLLRQN